MENESKQNTSLSRWIKLSAEAQELLMKSRDLSLDIEERKTLGRDGLHRLNMYEYFDDHDKPDDSGHFRRDIMDLLKKDPGNELDDIIESFVSKTLTDLYEKYDETRCDSLGAYILTMWDKRKNDFVKKNTKGDYVIPEVDEYMKKREFIKGKPEDMNEETYIESKRQNRYDMSNPAENQYIRKDFFEGIPDFLIEMIMHINKLFENGDARHFNETFRKYSSLIFTEKATWIIKENKYRLHRKREIWEEMVRRFLNYFMSVECNSFDDIEINPLKLNREFEIKQSPDEELGFPLNARVYYRYLSDIEGCESSEESINTQLSVYRKKYDEEILKPVIRAKWL